MEQVLPLGQAIARVFARLGEKKNRQKARLKFVVQKLGIDEFKRVVMEELKTVPSDAAACGKVGRRGRELSGRSVHAADAFE